MGEGLLGLANKGLQVVDQLVVDEDLKNKLKFEFANNLLTALYTGKGSSITKIVSVCLVAIISLTLLAVYLIQFPKSGIGIGELFIGPGMLVGSYGTGKTVQKVMEKKYGNGNAINGSQTAAGGSYKTRSPKPYQPTREQTRRPSDTKRDHPGGR